MSRLVSFDDAREKARRRLPRFAFDFIDGGAGTETGLERNRKAFINRVLEPRALINVDGDLSTRTRLLGKNWAAPYGVAPIGLAGLAWPGVDRLLACAAEQAGVPYCASTPSTTNLEDLHDCAPNSGWFQLYVGSSEEIVDDLIDRARIAGYDSLIVTADVPRPGKRRRDLRNQFALPLKITPRFVWELARHPQWSLAVLRQGAPRFANLERYATPGASTTSLASLMAKQSSGRLDWDVLADIRAKWSGKLILKGILSPEDAKKAMNQGVDAIVVSNHGGRQLDGAPASLDALGPIRDAVGSAFPLIVDGGIRSGEDILKALMAGADFVLMGRAFLYSVAALGPQGATEAFAMLGAELTNAMAQTGLRDIVDISK